MGARQKLNQVYATASLLLATFIGCLAQSWAAFVIALIVLLALNLLAGDIRPNRRDRGET